MCTVLLPPGINPIAVNKYINIHLRNFVVAIPFREIKNNTGTLTL